jgi:hypothetical protein
MEGDAGRGEWQRGRGRLSAVVSRRGDRREADGPLELEGMADNDNDTKDDGEERRPESWGGATSRADGEVGRE